MHIGAPQCIVCGSRSLDGVTCDGCREKTELRRVWAPFSYKDEVIRNALHIYKYGRAQELAEPLGVFLISALKRSFPLRMKNTVIIPIPLHWRRKRERGFNQSELLAKRVGAAFQIPVSVDSLIRTRNTPPQIKMEDDEQRKANITNAFSVKNPETIQDKTVLLIDDVATSGSTLEEAARILRESGARTVWAATVAHR